MKLRCLNCWLEFESEDYSICCFCFGDTMIIENTYIDHLIENIRKVAKENCVKNFDWVMEGF